MRRTGRTTELIVTIDSSEDENSLFVREALDANPIVQALRQLPTVLDVCSMSEVWPSPPKET